MLPKRVQEYLANLPPDSKVRAARDYGVDLSLTLRNMYELTPNERLIKLEKGADWLKFLRRRGSA